jgi:hypothetical protein
MHDCHHLAADIGPGNYLYLARIEICNPASNFLIPLFLSRCVRGFIQALKKRVSQSCSGLGRKRERLSQQIQKFLRHESSLNRSTASCAADFCKRRNGRGRFGYELLADT